MSALDTLWFIRTSIWSFEEWKVLIALKDYGATVQGRAEQRDQIDGRLFYAAGISFEPSGLKLAQPLNPKEKN